MRRYCLNELWTRVHGLEDKDIALEKKWVDEDDLPRVKCLCGSVFVLNKSIKCPDCDIPWLKDGVELDDVQLKKVGGENKNGKNEEKPEDKI